MKASKGKRGNKREKGNPTRKGEEEIQIPLKIIGDLVFKTCRRIDLPLNEFLLEAIASNLTESLEMNQSMRRE